MAEERIRVGRKWLEDYADPEEKLELYLDRLPETINQLTETQIHYLEKLIPALEALTEWDGETLQTTLFAISKDESIGITQPIAFQALYRCFMGKDRGPKAGALLSYLDRAMVIQRLRDGMEASQNV
jgi:lysyl-tRNA synthetase, class I